MDSQSKSRMRRRLSLLTLQLAMGWAFMTLVPAHAAAEATDAAATSDAPMTEEKAAIVEAQGPQDPGHRRHSVSPLDRRVNLLAKELDLDARQRVQVKKILEEHRAQVDRVWNDTAMAAAVRVGTTQAIGDRTAAQIRALLNEEQRKKYIQARKRDTKVGTTGADVETWMNASKAKK